MKRSTIYSTSVLLVLILIGSIIPVAGAEKSHGQLAFVSAADRSSSTELFNPPVKSQTIRIAQIDLSNFFDYEKNVIPLGYGYEYLQEIANYTGWSYEFVPVTAESGLKLLEEGSIDLLAPVAKTPELMQRYDFSEKEIGLNYSLLCVAVENNSVAFNDFEALDKMKIGLLENAPINASIESYAEKKHFNIDTIFFSNQAAQLKALHDGKIDAILTSSLEKRPTERVIARFSPVPYYFITAKGNNELLNPLNDAIADIKESNPYHDYELQKKYYDYEENSIPIFTEEEKRFIKNSGVLSAVFNAYLPPIEYFDKESNGFTGINADIMALISEKSGLKFSYLKAHSYTEALRKISDDQAVMLTGAGQSAYWSDLHGLLLTEPYLTASVVLVKNKNVNNLDSATAALVRDSLSSAEYIKKTNPEIRILYFNSPLECFEAVNSGRASITYANSYVAEKFLESPRLDNLEIVRTENITEEISIAVSESANPILLSILNKSLRSISDAQLNGIIFQHTVNAKQEISLEYLFYKNPGFLLLFLFVLFLATTAAFTFVIKTKNTHTREIKKVAYTDSVTGTWNYNRFKVEAKSILENQKNKKYALFYIDINKFSYFNDTFGYQAGDLILSEVSKEMQRHLRDTECSARFSADNFVCLMEYESDLSLIDRGRNFQKKCEERLKKINSRYKIYFTTAIYRIPPGETDIPSIVGKADIAHKTLGNVRKESFVVYNEKIQNEFNRKKELESSMYSALRNQEFVVYLQPKMDLISNTIVGAEALVRWQRPKEGLIPPLQFIPLFESNGFILDLDFYVYENVCILLRRWLDEGKPAIPISVNVSKAHLSNQQFVAHLKALTNKYQIPADLLELELTETIFFHNSEEAFSMIRELKKLGFPISIDDFGSGYSSLNLLKDLVVDVLKLDKEFFRKEGMTQKDKIIVDGIIQIANDLNLKIISEGVETKEQVDFLISSGCHMAQGFYFARPMAIDAFEYLAGFRK
ncbi:MAG: signaling protein [Bacillota bacterium]|jgi:diguanylate cyclase (GGDEF)-like protein|nr:signaling protein [Bacillota bacterium]